MDLKTSAPSTPGGATPASAEVDPTRQFRRLLLLAPLLFAAHVAEEAPGFVAWMNAHVSRPITPELFLRVNLAGALITTAVAAAGYLAPAIGSALLAFSWLSFLMAANAILHLAGAVVDGGYAPGVVTGAILYLPYFAWLSAAALRSGAVPPLPYVLAVLAGAAPMLSHGWLILFRGERLF